MRLSILTLIVGTALVAGLPSPIASSPQVGIGRYVVEGTNRLADTDAFCCLTARVRGRELPFTQCMKIPHPMKEYEEIGPPNASCCILAVVKGRNTPLISCFDLPDPIIKLPRQPAAPERGPQPKEEKK